MISRSNRFHGYRALGKVYRFGSTARGPLFGVKARPNDRRRTYRAAIVVGRKINKSAVTRNRIRRRLYEAIRELSPQLDGAYDIIINVYHDSVAEQPHTELKGQLKKQLKQIGAIAQTRR